MALSLILKQSENTYKPIMLPILVIINVLFPHPLTVCYELYHNILLSDFDHTLCDAPISEDEITTAAFQLNRGKTPSWDGLTVDFIGISGIFSNCSIQRLCLVVSMNIAYALL